MKTNGPLSNESTLFLDLKVLTVASYPS